MTEPNMALIERFYRAFDEGDGKTMAACYAPDVQFSDPVFSDLRGPRAGAMWQMFTEGPGKVRVELLESGPRATRAAARVDPDRARYGSAESVEHARQVHPGIGQGHRVTSARRP